MTGAEIFKKLVVYTFPAFLLISVAYYTLREIIQDMVNRVLADHKLHGDLEQNPEARLATTKILNSRLRLVLLVVSLLTIVSLLAGSTMD